MGRKKMEEINLDLGEETIVPVTPIESPEYIERRKENYKEEKDIPSCLRNEKIIARYIMQKGNITNTRHVLYGGLAETAVKIFTVPILSSGLYVNVLTDKEKSFLEYIMGLEPNSLSIYKKNDNFWDNFQVRLGKYDTYFDLRNPEDYIKYKVLLANKEMIASSISELEDKPKATYRYVLISEKDSNKAAKQNMSATMEAYKLFGKYEKDTHTLRVIAELLTQKSISSKANEDFIHSQINSIIQSNTKLFISVAKDEYLPYKVIVKRGVEKGLIAHRGGFYYLKDGNVPMCNDNEDPTLNSASRWLSLPKNQEIKFKLEATINDN